MDVIAILLGLAGVSYAVWALSKGAIHYKKNWREPMMAHPRKESPALYWFFLILWAAIGFGTLVGAVFG